MNLFKRKKSKKEKINEEFVKKNAANISEEDVERVFKDSDKIKSKIESNSRFDKFVTEAKTMLALIRDYWKKEYTDIPWYAMTAIVFTMLYVLNPMDLSPDYIPFIGYVDDVTVLSFALTLVNKDLSAYKKWKELKDDEDSENLPENK